MVRGKEETVTSGSKQKRKRLEISRSIQTAGTPSIACNHNINFCKAVLLSQADIEAFTNLLYSHSNLDDQKAFLMNYEVPYEPVRKRSQNDNLRKRTSCQYYIRPLIDNLVVTCAKIFSSIVMFGKYHTAYFYVSNPV